ncbi:MAG: RagB/SusD family nutrient uptake outer membrane protein [Chitinophagaceae bacterium]|nr:RagB/SusD family nutrient uptake outer membrane protein [Chitinophagaceae bacterium]
MKKIIIFGGFIICLMLLSCSKEFLTKTDPTRLGVNTFFKDKDQIERALNGVYGQLQSITNDEWLYSELTTDNTTVDFNPDDRGQASNMEQFEFWVLNPGTPSIRTMYNKYYNALFNINYTLSKLPDVSDPSMKEAEGQLKFLRAYYYFNLTRYFGDVILITEALDDPSKAWDYAREPQSNVYNQIEQDLKDAVGFLPVNYDAAGKGKVTKGAALALLGQLYLTKKQFGDAVTTLNQILTLGYSLLPSYADVFDPGKKNSVESIFEVQYQGGNDLGEWSSFVYTFAPRLSKDAITGWSQSNPGGWGIPTKDLIASYEDGDTRKAASIGLDFTSPITGDVVPYIRKYAHPHAIYGRTDDDWPIFRYSNVLLMLAEAINEDSGPSDAYAYLNQVRARAGLGALSGLTKETFREAVYHERRIELAFENDRWFFLKRTRTAEELATFLNDYASREKSDPTVTRQGIPYSSGDYIFSAFESVFPIPADEIRVNNKLAPNPGY